MLDEALLFYCGLLSLQPRSAVALEQVLADYFDVPVEIEQFVGAWHPLDPRPISAAWKAATRYSDQLGLGAVAGDEIWDRQSRARIKLGPLTRDAISVVSARPATPGSRCAQSPRFSPAEKSNSKCNWC